MIQAIEEETFYEGLESQFNLQNIKIQIILRVGHLKKYPRPYSKRSLPEELIIGQGWQPWVST
ncbi:MAG: hypothetical protein ABI045_04935 [Flavobacteriales bacterium]